MPQADSSALRPTRGSSGSFEPAFRSGPELSAYLALLPMGFALPPMSPPARCALTAPFHPYGGLRPGGEKGREWKGDRTRSLLSTYYLLLFRAQPSAVYFLWHFPSVCTALMLSSIVPCAVRTFLTIEGVATRHRAIESAAATFVVYPILAALTGRRSRAPAGPAIAPRNPRLGRLGPHPTRSRNGALSSPVS